MKIYVEQAVWEREAQTLIDTLPPMREMLCRRFAVDNSLCHLILLPVHGIGDQTPVSLEIQILPKPERTRELILSACTELQAMLSDRTGVKTTVRATALDPETYIALR